MAKDADQIVVASSGAVYVAPVGTAINTDPAGSLSATWRELGYVTEEGVTFSDSPDVGGIPAWQAAGDVRKLVNSRARSVSTTFEQWNDATFPTVFGGGSWSALGGGKYKFSPPADTASLDVKSLVVDWVDGSRHFRLHVQKFSATGGIETQLIRTGAAVLPFTGEILVPDSGDAYNLYSDDPVFAEGGS